MKQFISDVNKGRNNDARDNSGNKSVKNNEAALDLSSPPLKSNTANNNQSDATDESQSEKVFQQDTSQSQESENDNQIYEFDDPGMEIENYSSEVGFDQLSPSDPKKRCRTAMSPTQVQSASRDFSLHLAFGN